jgi:hypothetical protein
MGGHGEITELASQVLVSARGLDSGIVPVANDSQRHAVREFRVYY